MKVVSFNLRAPTPRTVPPRKRIIAPRRGNRAAQQLALAHAIAQWIEDGTAIDHAEVAHKLGVTRARIAQIAALRYLAPTIQADILANKNIHERSLRAATRFVDWDEQVAALESKVK